MASSSSSPSPASSSRSFKYDVFLSFRGEDTRKTFVDHLYSALVHLQIRTYKDDETLPRGESIGPSLFKSIEESRIAVIIFSENYADSSWCLEELAHIMKCKDERGLIVMPIFYDVDPSEVRKQKRKFGEAFAKHEGENISKAKPWRKALVDASKIAGWEPKNIANGHESKAIKEIVDTISDKLFSITSNVGEDLVGLMARSQDLISLLKIGSGGVSVVGIWGVGGGGKTTLATSVCMEVSHLFDGHCIVENIGEESLKHGLRKLQNNMLLAIFKKEFGVQSVPEGKIKLKGMLCHRNVLVILDDVNDLGQLEALAGSHNWFGSGSRIIITTRNKDLLETHKVDQICPIRLLSDEEAIQLFNKHACNEKDPIKNYEKLSLSVVSYAAGLPLALKVLGSFLYNKNEEEWMSALARLKDIPEMEIVEKLKISYDGLKTLEKELFLDIACFFRRKSKDKAMEILDACGFHPKIGIKALIQKALITINLDGRIDMHDLVQEMGHHIVRGEHPHNPEKHSRVWKIKEIINMSYGDATMAKENDKIEAITYHPKSLADIVYYDEAFESLFYKTVSNMKKLRWLRVCAFGFGAVEGPNFLSNELRYIYEGPNFLSNELRYIYWKSYPATPFSDSFQPMNLVVLKLVDSRQKELWKGYKRLPHLKVLELCSMRELLSTPDFKGLPCLQKLSLHECEELKKIHPSLGNHKSLEYVKVSWCHKLRKFPTIVHMENLKTLKLEGPFLAFPEIQANMESLVKLYVNDIWIEVLPSSIGERCTNLISLDLGNCYNLKSIEFNFGALKHLKELRFHGSTQLKKTVPQLFDTMLVFYQLRHSLRKLVLGRIDLQDEEIPSEIGELSNLLELDLSRNDFKRLDFSLSQLTRLKLLDLSDCHRLVELPELPSSVAILKADRCVRLKAIGDCHTNCKWLCQVSLEDGCIINDGGRLLEFMLQGKAIENHSMSLQLQGLEIAKRFKPHLRNVSRCTLQLPENWCNDYYGFLMCFFSSRDCSFCHSSISMKQVRSGSMGMDSEHDVVWEESVGDTDKVTWVRYVSFGSLRHTAWWNSTYKVLSFSVGDYYKDCRGFGVSLVSRKSESGPTETSTPSHEESDYIPNIKIEHDSANALEISFKSL